MDNLPDIEHVRFVTTREREERMGVYTKYAEPQVTRGPVESITIGGPYGTALVRPRHGTATWDISMLAGVGTGVLNRADLEYLLHRLHQLHEDLRMVEQAAEMTEAQRGR